MLAQLSVCVLLLDTTNLHSGMPTLPSASYAQSPHPKVPLNSQMPKVGVQDLG